MSQPTVEELLAKLKAVEDQKKTLEEENVKLKQQIVDGVKSQVHSKPEPRQYTLSERTPVVKILGRPDEGVGLIGETVAVAGWARTMRVQGKGEFAFIELADGTINEGLQVVIDEHIPDYHQITQKVHTGASVFIVGEVVKSPGKNQKVEMQGRRVTVLGVCDPDVYPLAKKQHTLEHLRTIGHLRPRSKTIGAVARLRNALAMATHEYFQSKGFFYLHTPLITASDCEGAGEMFNVSTLLKADGKPPVLTKDGKVDFSQDFFRKPAFLTVSGQLNGEIYACAVSNVYTFGPTFRAENSNTTRHLAEFWMIEPEIAFADLAEDMDVAEGYIKHVIKFALEKCSGDLAFFEQLEKLMAKEKAKEAAAAGAAKPAEKKEKGAKKAPAAASSSTTAAPDWKSVPLRDRLKAVISAPFARITYTEAIEILEKSGVQFVIPCPKWGDDLNSEHERYIAEVVFKKPVIVTNYPKALKAFYMRANEDGKTCAAMDILVPGVGEIIGGSQREERIEVLEARIKELGLDPETYSWYLDLRRYGTVPHAGFGLGFERLVCYTSGLENIRDAIPFPRYPGHADY